MSLIDLVLYAAKNHKVFSFIGMAKNVGKTTTYNYVIKNLQSKFTIGITSIGRDGENKDILTQLPKPKIFVSEGNLLATAKESLDRSEVQYEVLKTTDINTPLGNIILIKVHGSGNIELSGPSIVKHMRKITDDLKSLGAELVLIDGAFDRKSFASPIIAEATILATGAALSHDIDEVIHQTVFSLQKLSSPVLTDPVAHNLITQFFKTHKAGIMDKENQIKAFPVLTALNATKSIIRSIRLSTKHILIKGIVSSTLLREIIMRNLNCSSFSIIAEDGTKLFITPELYAEFYSRGGRIYTLNPINIIAVTTNPLSPYGIMFNHKELLERLRSQITIPVFDVVSGG